MLGALCNDFFDQFELRLWSCFKGDLALSYSFFFGDLDLLTLRFLVCESCGELS